MNANYEVIKLAKQYSKVGEFWICKICGYRDSSRKKVQEHIYETHGKERSVPIK